MWASYDFMYGANTAISHTGRNHYKGNTDYCLLDTHTYIHEVGHILGVEDYYDYSKQVSPVGGFTMQDNNVGGHDPFSVMAYGWASPYVPTESCRIKIYPFQDNNDVILLTPNWNSVNSVFDEYLLLELYTPTGLNAFDTAHRYAPHGEGLYPSGSGDTGIRVWHVDARLCPKNTSGKWVDNFFSDVEHPPISCFDKSTAFTNTYKERGVDTPHMSKVYSVNNNYENFDLLRLIRKASGVELRTKAMFSSADLFYEGDSFDMDTYGSQFAYKSFFGGEQNVLDSGAQLGWSFVIEELTSDYAIIQLTRA